MQFKFNNNILNHKLRLSKKIKIEKVINIKPECVKSLSKKRDIVTPESFVIEHINEKKPALLIHMDAKKIIEFFEVPMTPNDVYEKLSKSTYIDFSQYSAFIIKMYHQHVLVNADILFSSYFFCHKIHKIISAGTDFIIYEIESIPSNFIVKTVNNNLAHSQSRRTELTIKLIYEYNIIEYLKQNGLSHITPIIDIDEENCFFKMAKIKGEIIKEFSKKINSYELFRTIALLILNELNKIHDLGYLHGDIHFSNIICEDANSIHIIDFGLTRKINEITLVQEGGVTPFLSPELAEKKLNPRMENVLTVKSELYSIGVLLFFLLKKEFPISLKENIYLSDYLTAIVTQPPKEITVTDCFGDKTLPRAIASMLAKNPNNRPNSISDFCKNAFDIIL